MYRIKDDNNNAIILFILTVFVLLNINFAC